MKLIRIVSSSKGTTLLLISFFIYWSLWFFMSHGTEIRVIFQHRPYGPAAKYLLSNLHINNEDAIPAFARRLGGTLDSVEHLRFTTCYILKNMHSVLQTLTCYLQPDTIKQRVFTLNISDPFIWRPAPCIPERTKKKWTEHVKKFSLQNWTRLLLVRHPVARLISGWVHFW